MASGGSPWRQHLPPTPHPRSCSPVSWAQDEGSLPCFSGQRKEANGCEIALRFLERKPKQNKTKHKTKSSARSLSYPEGSNCSSQISQPGLCCLLSPGSGPCPGGTSPMGTGAEAGPLSWSSCLGGRCRAPLGELQDRAACRMLFYQGQVRLFRGKPEAIWRQRR